MLQQKTHEEKQILTYNEVKDQLQNLEVEESEVYDNELQQIKGNKLLRYKDTKEPIRIMSSKYTVFQHTDAFDRMIHRLENSKLNYEIRNIITNTSSGRNSIQISFAFPEISWNVDGSKTEATMEMINSCDGMSRYQEILGVFRLLCSNGMVIGDKLYHLSKKHSKKFTSFLEDQESIQKILDEYEHLSKSIQKSREVKATKDFIQELIKAGFPSTIIKNLPEAFEKYQDMYQETIKDYTKIWAYYAVLTNWLSHSASQTNIERGNRLSRKLSNIIIKYTS